MSERSTRLGLANPPVRRTWFVIGLVFGLCGLLLFELPQNATAYRAPVFVTATTAPTSHPPIRVAGRETMRLGYGQARALAWSPDATRVAVGGNDGVWIFSDTLTPIKHMTAQPADTVLWTSDGKSIGITLDVPYYVETHLRDQDDLGAALYDVETGVAQMTFPRLKTPGAWSPDGRYYAHASPDSSIHVCSVLAGWCELRYRGHTHTDRSYALEVRFGSTRRSTPTTSSSVFFLLEPI